jgi:hypothetical protein
LVVLWVKCVCVSCWMCQELLGCVCLDGVDLYVCQMI